MQIGIRRISGKQVVANSILKTSRRNYTRMTTEEYLLNARQSMANTQIQEKYLQPLLEANHTSDTLTLLHGIPKIPKSDGSYRHVFAEAVTKTMPDLVFLQMDPMPFIVRQRYLAHKCALHEIEDYDIKGVENLNHPAPYTWQEAVVNLITIDMLRTNQTHMLLDYTKGVCTYAYPDLQSQRERDNNHDKFIEAVTDHIICD